MNLPPWLRRLLGLKPKPLHHVFEFVVTGLTTEQAGRLMDVIIATVEIGGGTVGGGFALADENGELPGERES